KALQSLCTGVARAEQAEMAQVTQLFQESVDLLIVIDDGYARDDGCAQGPASGLFCRARDMPSMNVTPGHLAPVKWRNVCQVRDHLIAKPATTAKSPPRTSGP